MLKVLEPFILPANPCSLARYALYLLEQLKLAQRTNFHQTSEIM
jgi:hypothetical protein